MHWTKHRRGNRSLTDPLFQVCSLTWGGSGQDTWVSEACLEQAADDKEEEDGCNDGDGQGEVTGKEGAAVKRKKIKKMQCYQPSLQNWLSAVTLHAVNYHMAEAHLLCRDLWNSKSQPTKPWSGTGKTGSSAQRRQYKTLYTTPLPFRSPRVAFQKNLSAAPKLGHLLQQQHHEHMEKQPKLGRDQNQRERDPIWSNT